MMELWSRFKRLVAVVELFFEIGTQRLWDRRADLQLLHVAQALVLREVVAAVRVIAFGAVLTLPILVVPARERALLYVMMCT